MDPNSPPPQPPHTAAIQPPTDAGLLRQQQQVEPELELAALLHQPPIAAIQPPSDADLLQQQQQIAQELATHLRQPRMRRRAAVLQQQQQAQQQQNQKDNLTPELRDLSDDQRLLNDALFDASIECAKRITADALRVLSKAKDNGGRKTPEKNDFMSSDDGTYVARRNQSQLIDASNKKTEFPVNCAKKADDDVNQLGADAPHVTSEASQLLPSLPKPEDDEGRGRKRAAGTSGGAGKRGRGRPPLKG